jgi:hypothetical protein
MLRLYFSVFLALAAVEGFPADARRKADVAW